MENKDRKCVIRSKDYGGSYKKGVASYVSPLIDAEIYNYSDIPDHEKKDSNNEIIFLDSRQGLELLAKNLGELDQMIPQIEKNLKKMKEGREKILQANPEMLSRYIELYNHYYHPVIGMSENQEEVIFNRIMEEHQEKNKNF